MTRKRWAVSPVLVDEAIPEHVRQELVDTTDDGLMAVIVELNLEAGVPPTEVANRFKALLAGVLGDDRAEGRSYEISTGYQRCLLRREEITELLMADHDNRDDVGRRAIFRIWPDYVIRPQIDLSCSTIKVDAASRTYAASGAEIVWAVLDTGIDGGHPHFSEGTLDDPKVKDLHADFTWLVRREPEPSPLDRKAALSDEDGHGTHVAGIIAGRTPDDYQPYIASLRPTVGDQNVDDADWPKWTQRQLGPGRTLAGMAPQARLISLKVLDSSTGVPRTTSSTLMRALQYVREMNGWGRNLQIHGVNLSLGCRWLPEDYAAGQSPLCRELNLLVGTGVVAVVSAGNSGSAIGGEVESGGQELHGLLASISEPGHAEGAITVGSTHRDSPHTFGISYTSAKGPTLDGRLKPDLVAPGERITSAASGKFLLDVPLFKQAGAASNGAAVAGAPGVGAPGAGASDGTRRIAYYAEESGTSMAAPHVSGAIAAFLSIRREFIGQPEAVKDLFCQAAISLNRDRSFQGYGLVDLMGVLAKV
jgi:subtilisin family serine protease